MPVVQETPPGHLDLHIVLVALTPGLLALATAISVSVLGRGRFANALSWFGLVCALALQLLFLLPGGAASLHHEALFHGLIRIGWAPDLFALILAAWAFLYWRSPRRAPWSWCAHVGIALLYAVALVPALLIAFEPDVVGDGAQLVRWRPIRFCAVVMATLALPLAVYAPLVATAAASLVAVLTSRGPWRWWIFAGAVVALLPPYPPN